jgi:hypothetical protein
MGLNIVCYRITFGIFLIRITFGKMGLNIVWLQWA